MPFYLIALESEEFLYGATLSSVCQESKLTFPLFFDNFPSVQDFEFSAYLDKLCFSGSKFPLSPQSIALRIIPPENWSSCSPMKPFNKALHSENSEHLL